MSLPQPTSSPLHLLANVASEAGRYPSHRSDSPQSDGSSPSPPSHSRTSSASTTDSSVADSLADHHLRVPSSSKRLAFQIHRPLSRLNFSPSSLLSPDPNFVPYIRPRKRARKNTELTLRTRMQMKARRKELMEKAIKIKSLDNSPVNERQLLVLRMVYDEITMYPCESWMVLVAIIIHR